MFSHVTLGTNDWERAKPFWAAIASALSLPLLFEHDSGIAYGEMIGEKSSSARHLTASPPQMETEPTLLSWPKPICC